MRSRLSLLSACALALLLGAPLPVEAGPLPPADRVIVVKSKRQLTLMRRGKVMKNFKISLGREPLGAKRFAGDGRTPEGTYRLTAWNPNSRFYRSIRISYPMPEDKAAARAFGRSPGGDIMIHGLSAGMRSAGAGHYRFDWTEGCLAVTDAEMDVIWDSVQPGTPIEILP